MVTKQVMFRLADSKLIALDNDLSAKGLSKQFFFSKCVDLFLAGELSFDSNVIANDSKDLDQIKKQLEIVEKRLTELEGTITPESKNKGSNDSATRAKFKICLAKLGNIPSGEIFPNQKEILRRLGMSKSSLTWRENKKVFLDEFNVLSDRQGYQKK